MDLGIYPLYVIVDLFGMPQRLKYSAVQGANGVDLFGNAILYYDQFQVSLLVSKAIHSTQASEIYLDNEVIAIQDITRIRTVSYLIVRDRQQLSANISLNTIWWENLKPSAKFCGAIGA